MTITTSITGRLEALGLTLPQAAPAVANYVPWVRLPGGADGDLVVVSGQLPLRDGTVMHPGILGDSVALEDGVAAARQCAINLLSQARAAAGGDIDRVVRLVRLGGFVACTPAFTDHPKVVNGASDLMVDVLGEAGRHARAAVGCPSLPLNACVEVEGMFLVR